MISVMIDTNALRGAGWRAASLGRLFTLSSAGDIDLYMSHVVVEELRTQWLAQYEAQVSATLKAVRVAANDPLLQDRLKTAWDGVRAAIEPLKDAKAASQASLEAYLAQRKVQVVEVDLEEYQEMLEMYFDGTPPFSGVKSRDDIPDALIYLNTRRIAASVEQLFVVGADKRLAAAIDDIENAKCVSDVDELLLEPDLVDLQAELETQQLWHKLKSAVTRDRLKPEVESFLKANQDRILAYKEVRSRVIPDDNDTAVISMYDEIEDVELENIEDWGGGWITIPVTFQCSVLADFYIYRSDAFDVPSWVSVSYGDFEDDHYFEAQADLELSVQIRLSARVDLREPLDDGAPLLGEIDIEDTPRFSVLNEEELMSVGPDREEPWSG